MAIPFYGGVNGQSFKIVYKFPNHAALIEDIENGWNSSICNVGEYVVIDYGEPGSDDYADNRDKDSANYNGTLWQKIYSEDARSSAVTAATNGICYERLFYVAPPSTKFNAPQTTPVSAGTAPSVNITPDGWSDNYTLIFSLPAAWDIQAGTITRYPPNQTTVTIGEETYPLPYFEIVEDNGVKKINYHLNYTQDIQETVPVTLLAAAATAGSASLDKTTNGTPQNPQLKISLPANQYFNADAFDISLLGPAASPSVSQKPYSDDDMLQRYPKYILNMPRSSKYMWGTKLQATADTAATDNDFTSLEIGDIYINTTLAAVHEIMTKPSATSVTTHYLGSFQLPVPTAQASSLVPYDANGNPVQPTAGVTPAVGPTTAWRINLGLPAAPKAALDGDNSGYVSSFEEGEIGAAARNDTIYFTFKVPRGTRFYAGVDRSTIDTMKAGDLYLADDGQVWKYNGTEWVEDTANLKGDVGDPINIINSVSEDINGKSTAANPVDETPEAIGAELATRGYDPKPNEVINVTYQTDDGNISYWLFKNKGDGKWNWSKLTGNTSGLILNEESEATDKTYSAGYINNLIATLQNTITSLSSRIETLEGTSTWGKLPISTT